MKRNTHGLTLLLSSVALSAFVACSNAKKDDPKPAPSETPAGTGPHAVSECPEGVEGFYASKSQTRDSFRYFSIHKKNEVLTFNQSPSAKRDEKTDIPVNGQKKAFPENKEFAASCSGKSIRIESFRDGVLVSWTMIAFGDGQATVDIHVVNFSEGKASSTTALPTLQFEKSALPPERAEEPAAPGLDKNGCPNDIVGKYASRDEALYLKFTKNEAGNLTVAASTFTADYPAVELNNSVKSDGDGGTLTGECSNGMISVIGVSGNGDVSTMQVKKSSDKTLDVKKLKNGKTVKSDTYDKIR